MLSTDERIRFEGIRHPRARSHFLAGRAALRSLLADRLALCPASVPLMASPDGGVDVPGTSLRASIAHAGNWAVAAVAPHIIGVDLERIQKRAPRLVDFMLHPSERDAYEALPLNAERRLILYWTLKEAVLKALRTGLRRSPKRVQLSVDVPSGSGRALLEDGLSLLLRFAAYDGYYLSVAYAQ